MLSLKSDLKRQKQEFKKFNNDTKKGLYILAVITLITYLLFN